MLDSWLASDWTAITGNPGKLLVAAGISDAATPTAYQLACSQRAVASIDLVRHPLHRAALRTLWRCDPELDRGHHRVGRRRCGAPPPPLRVAGHSFACMHPTFVPTSSCPFQFIPVSSFVCAHPSAVLPPWLRWRSHGRSRRSQIPNRPADRRKEYASPETTTVFANRAPVRRGPRQRRLASE